MVQTVGVPADCTRNDAIRGQKLDELYNDTCQQVGVKPDPNVVKILTGQYSREVQTLDFSSNYLGLNGMAVLLDVIAECPSLESLSFENNYLKPESIPHLVKIIKGMPSLCALNLANNSTLGFSTAKLLLQLVKNNKQITELELHGTGIVPATKDLIAKYLTENATSAQYWANKSIPKSLSYDYTAVGKKDAADMMVVSMGSNASGSPATTPKEPSPPASKSTKAPRPGSVTSQGSQKGEADNGEPQSDEDVLNSGYKPAANFKKNEVLAKEAQATNTNLAENAKGAAGRLQALHYQQTQRTTTMLGEVQSRHAQVNQLIVDLDEQYKSPAYYFGYNTEKLIQEAQLMLSEDDLVTYGKIYGVGTDKADKLVGIPPLLEKLKHADTTLAEKLDIIAQLEELCYIREHSDAIPHVAKCYDCLHSKIIDLPYVLKTFRETDDDLDRLILERDNWNDKKEEAFRNGNIGQAEEYHDKSLDVQDKLLRLAIKRVDTLRDLKGQAHLQHQVKDAEQKVNIRLAQCARDAEEVMKTVEEDTAKLDEVIIKRRKVVEEKKREYDMFCILAKDRIKAAQARQYDVYDEIDKRFKELEELGEYHHKEYMQYFGNREEYEAEQCALWEFEETWRIHRYNINCLTGVCQKMMRTTDDFAEFFHGIPERIIEKSNETWTKTQELTVAETRMCLEYFEPYLLSLGPMIWKKEKRLDELDRMSRSIAFSVEMCADTMDPNARKYEMQANELQFQKGAIERKIEKYRGIGDEAVEMFEPIAKLLQEMGHEFEHPSLKLHEEMVEGVQRVMVKKRQQHESEQYHIDRDDDEIQKQTMTVKKAKDLKSSQLLPALSAASPRAKKGNLMFE
uniref:Uncharacterized protein n=1 Tax=Eutreptiella gymnastica TaxID=73025 RepID=A0A7S1JA23_9EUGL|mmetsp:Transcript_78716/g.139071  ORF Transcript_78716/g.139071 Transcript_78716/m.139071 type:complete len:853 (+) Transcript_78716:66-2624(+)